MISGTGLSQACVAYATLNCAVLVGVSAAVIVQRHHLFVWSVMAPRFVYAAVETALVCAVCAMYAIFRARSVKDGG